MQPQSMNKNVSVLLLIQDERASIEPIREALSHQEGRFRLQMRGKRANRPGPAWGRRCEPGAAGSLVAPRRERRKTKPFSQASSWGARPAYFGVLPRRGGRLALSAVRAGAADYMIKERCATDLEHLLQSVLERHRRPLDSIHVEARKAATMITLLGAKGGVGTTTVALNVGSVLAGRNNIVSAHARNSRNSFGRRVKREISQVC